MSDIIGSGTQKPDSLDDDAINNLDASSFTNSNPDEPSPEVRLSTIYTNIRDPTDYLLRLSVAITSPTLHKRFRKFSTIDISY
jgi:hypothetical protein